MKKLAITANIGKLDESANFKVIIKRKTEHRSDKFMAQKAQPTHICKPLGTSGLKTVQH